MFKKKGVTQVDWTTSMAVFLIFLGFTFLTVAPQSTVFIDEKSALNNLKYNFIEDYSYDVKFLPIHIESQRTGLEPIVFPVEYDFDEFNLENNISFAFNRSVSDDLIFIMDITDNLTTQNLVYNSDATLPKFKANKIYFKRTNDSIQVPSKQLYVNYYQNTLENVSYLDKLRIYNFKILKNNQNEVSFSYNKISNHSQGAIIVLNNSYFLHKERIFADMSRIYMNFDSNIDYSVDFTTDTYTKYYFNNVIQGNFTFSEDTCINSTTDYVDLSNNISTMTLIMPRTRIALCTENGYVNIHMENPTYIEFHFSTDSPGSKYSKREPISIYSGLITSQTGISMQKINNLEKESIKSIRNRYDIPDQLEFSMFMTHINYTPIFLKESNQPTKNNNIFIKRWKDYIIYPDGEKELVLMGVSAWQ